MIYSDWIQSEHSKRVWLHDSMTALGQFAFIAPIHRVKHYNKGSGKRNKCWAKEGDCVFCKRGIAKINEFTYGIYHDNSSYSGGGLTEISYLSVTLAAHTQFQKLFTDLINDGKNPTDIVFEIKRTKIKTSSGRPVNGYDLNVTDNSMFVAEKFRPSLLNSEEQKKTQLELVAGLFRNTDKNGNVYYTGKSEGGDEYVMFRNSYWKEGASKPYFRIMKRVEAGSTTIED